MDPNQLLREVEYSTSTSGGPGGQHANRTESRVQAHWNAMASDALDDDEKRLLRASLNYRLTTDGILTVTSHKTRSQHQNKEIATQLLLQIVAGAIVPPKIRRATKPSRSGKMKRLLDKRRHKEKKANRRRPDY